MRPKPSHVPPPDSGPEFEARRAAILAENEAHDARLSPAERELVDGTSIEEIDARPFDITKELGGIDRRKKEFRVPRTPGKR